MLLSPQTAAKGGQRFDIAVGMKNLRGGDWDETQNGAHRGSSKHALEIKLVFPSKGLTKKLEEKTVDSYSLYVFFFGFYTQQNVNSSPITLTGVMYTVQCIVKNINCTLKFAFLYFRITLQCLAGPHSDCYIFRTRMIFKLFTFCLTFMLQNVTKLS